ncbi:MAG TPA: c-type cytochrome domain-containing protein, partial [Pirellulales bacterium]|nr:c-type cytochrome domain-containing protein [Pirellulales bacterium]
MSRFCTDCHGADSPEAHLNLEQLGAQPDFAMQFGAWQKVIERLKDGAMPPPDALQPTENERQTLIASIGAGLEAHISQHAGDPGRVV